MNGQRLPLALVGCDFRVASSRFRSRLVLPSEEADRMAAALRRNGWAEGLLVLETCNRNEWVVSGAGPEWAVQLLAARMQERLGTEARGVIHPYVLVGEAAARHLLRVAVGQESLVQGERQVATQLQRALDAARRAGRSCRVLNGLGSIAGRLVAIAERRGCIRDATAGVHWLAVRRVLAEKATRGGEPRRWRVAVVGLGEIGRKTAGLVAREPDLVPVLVNRTAPEGVHPLADLPAVLAEVDAAITCTAAPAPVVTAAQLPPRSPDRPLLLVDVGIPEQVARGVAGPGVTVAGLDDLVALAPREPGTNPAEAQALVERATREFQRFCAEPEFAGLLEEVRGRHRRLARETLPRLLRQAEGDPERLEAELKAVLGRYTNDILRAVREASRSGAGGEG